MNFDIIVDCDGIFIKKKIRNDTKNKNKLYGKK